MSRTPHDVVFVHALDLPEMFSAFRYMSLIPAEQIGARVLRIRPDEAPDAFIDRADAAVYVFGKPLDHDLTTRVCERAKARGLKTISWHCDALGAPGVLERLQRHAGASDAMVVQTPTMAEMIAPYCAKPPEIIEESLEFPAFDQPHFSSARTPLQVLWYGHAANFDTLPGLLESLRKSVGKPISLLTLSLTPLPDSIQKTIAQMRGPNFDAVWLAWSRGLQMNVMRSCDVVLLPSLDVAAKNVKGHNRITEALNQNCVVAAHPLPQYREFSDYAYLTHDVGAGIRQALAEPEKAIARAAAGAAAVRKRFAPEVLAQKWLALIDRVARG